MRTVYIANAPSDSPAARSLATILEGYGYRVWWSEHHPKGEAPIGTAAAADIVAVLWSEPALELPWVREVAEQAHARGRLVSALVRPGVGVPRSIAPDAIVSLSNALGQFTYQAYRRLVDTIVTKQVGGHPAVGAPGGDAYREAARDAAAVPPPRPPRWRKIANL